MTKNMQYILNQLRDISSDLDNSITELELETQEREPSTVESPYSPQISVIQARLRGNNVLHVQKGTKGNYVTTDVPLLYEKAKQFSALPHTAPSLYPESEKMYVLGTDVYSTCMTFGSTVHVDLPEDF